MQALRLLVFLMIALVAARPVPGMSTTISRQDDYSYLPADDNEDYSLQQLEELTDPTNNTEVSCCIARASFRALLTIVLAAMI